MTTPLDAALKYCRCKWNPVPVKFKSKVPIGDGWQQRVVTAESAATYFNGMQLNVGVILGPTSQGLTDVDLDCREAIVIAPYVLPRTSSRFGRPSKPCSHWLYTSDLATSVEKAALQYHHPTTGEMLVELRIGGGAQTVFPPSTHESGEVVAWEEEQKPAAVDGADLQRRVAALAAYSLIARHWPSQGARHDAALALGGFLARTGRAPAVVKTIAEAIARAANDEQWQDRRATAEDSAVNHGKGGKTYGFPQLAKHIGKEVAKQVAEWIGYKETATSADEEEERGAKPKQADALIRLAQEATLFHTGDGRSWADITVGKHRETWPIRSHGFKHWLRHRFWQELETAPSSEAIETALAHLEAAAHYDGAPRREVFTRVAAHGDKVYLDLADEAWTVIEVDANGWRVIKMPPVRFRRSAGMAPLPMPQAGGSLGLLCDLINMRRDDDDFVIVVAWPLAALRGKPPYPILALAGPPGSAKSTLAKFLRDLIDPNELAPGALPRETRDLAISASKRFVQAYDNLSGIPAPIADALCRLATGGGFAAPALYTNDDEIIFTDTRPVLLAGIEDVAGRHDLADRASAIVRAEIPEEERRLESALLAEFQRVRPLVLGRLLDIVAHGLRELPNVKLGKYPRMADFAHWMAACETAEWPAGTFARAYASNRELLTASSLEADAVAAAVVELVKLESHWTGTAKALLAKINAMVDDVTKKADDWPRSPRLMAGRLRRASAILRASRIKVVPPAKSDKTRTWSLSIAPDSPPRERGDEIAQIAQSPENEESANDSNAPGSGYCSGYRAMGDTSIAQPPDQHPEQPAPSGYRQPPDSPIAQPIARDNPLKNNGLGDVGYLGDVSGPLSGEGLCGSCATVPGDSDVNREGGRSDSPDGPPADAGVCVANGYAISASPEDRREPAPEHVSVEAWIKVIRPPGLGPPGDDLNDLIVF